MPFAQSEVGKFFTILGGRFAIRAQEGTEGAVARVNKLGKTVHEIFHDSFTAKLVDIKTRDSDAYGKSWIFSFKDGEEIYNLNLSYSNSYATAFLKMLPNIDVSKEFKVQPSSKLGEDGKQKSSLFISQGGTNIKHAYTRENPNGLPDMKQIVVKGQQMWDDSDRLTFLHDMVKRDILPKLEGVGEVKGEESKLAVNETASDDINADDIGF